MDISSRSRFRYGQVRPRRGAASAEWPIGVEGMLLARPCGCAGASGLTLRAERVTSSCSVAVVGLDEAQSSVEVLVLGPIELRRDGRTVGLTSAKEGLLLAALAQRANHVLSLDAAIDALWGEQPPISAKGLVHNYISRLRKACGPHNPVQSVPSGYRLVLGPDDLDAAVFERLIGEGRRQRASGEAETAIVLLEQALGLWRGAALGELAAEASMRGYAQRLEELRLHAKEERGEAMLALGRHGELVAELHDLVAEHPLREQFWSQLMRSLYSAGRQAEALRAARSPRRRRPRR
jgi:DNA-binding SARP family transcriptional activator